MAPHEQNDRHFADDILEYILANEKLYILIQISLKFVPNDSIDNKPVLVQVMAWCLTGDKPLSESMPTPSTDSLGGDQLIDQYKRHRTRTCISLSVPVLVSQRLEISAQIEHILMNLFTKMMSTYIFTHKSTIVVQLEKFVATCHTPLELSYP